MKQYRLVAFVAAALFAFAACAGSPAGGSRPGGILPGNSPVRAGTHARLRINVPPQKHRKKIRVRGHYISPATASLTYSVTPALSGGSTGGEIDISTSNPDCHTTGVVGYLTCTLDIAGVAPGTPYTFGFTTWDAAGGTGNQLSANDTVPFTANAGQSNVLQATLGGIVASFVVAPMPNARMSGSSALYTVYGNDPVKFSVVPIDADDNFILGPGAPQPSVAPSGGAPMAIATVGPGSPNEYALTSSYAPSDPSVPSSASLQISATPVPGSGGSTVSASVPVALYQPWIYIVDDNKKVRAYDEDGNVIPQFATFSTPGNGKQSIAFGNHRLYLWGSDAAGDASANYIAAYPPQGGAAIVSAGESEIPAIGNANHPGQIAYDAGNGNLYTQDQLDGLIMSFDGNLTQNLGAISASNYGGGLAYVAATNQIAFVTQSIVGLCDEALTSCPSIVGGLYGIGFAFDPNTSQFGTNSDYGGFQILSFSGSPGPKYGNSYGGAAAFDPYNRQWYQVLTGASPPLVLAFTESGGAVTLAGAFPGIAFSPDAIAIAP